MLNINVFCYMFRVTCYMFRVMRIKPLTFYLFAL